eukprot:NODE_4397_length_795_cov_32.380240_g4239_i0.p1 GENE.NODE_4397_length_795_cov_32.380240_g4239_i0~~NODE_4397_length_795_cov_32.380240_g4239_i0.p1  ORF type:complete len:222 (-),score=61.14 NODE_4397_length_795_cov_32.380240_g4239_i0:130-735(-)
MTLGHMNVGAGWAPGAAGRGVPNILKEVMGNRESSLQWVHKGRTPAEILMAMKFNLKVEKDLYTLAEAAGAAEPSENKVFVPTMQPGAMYPRTPQSITPKDKYQLAKQMVETKYHQSYVQKPWANMFFYYCDEDRARLSGGLGYTGHCGGGQEKNVSYQYFAQEHVYPIIFWMSLYFFFGMFGIYYFFFGTFGNGRRGRFD